MTNLGTLQHAELPAKIAAEARATALQSRSIALGKTLFTHQMLDNFDSASIPAIVLKGPATGTTAYGDPSLRTFGDVDFLVKPGHLVEARRLLISLGYVTKYDLRDEARLTAAGHALELASQNHQVELHSSLISKYLRVRFDTEEIWSSARTVAAAGRDILVLDRRTEFLFLCAHGTKHEWFNFRWICDVAQLTERLSDDDSTSLAELASKLHMRKLLAFGLELTYQLFGTLSPPPTEAVRNAFNTRPLALSVLRRLGAVEGASKSSSAMLSKIHPAIPSVLFWSRARERLQDRVGPFASLVLNQVLHRL